MGIVERVESISPGETVIDDGGRIGPQPGWRKVFAEALPAARAILLVIEPRGLLRAQVQPPGYDCVDELVPREIQRMLPDRKAPIVALLTGGAEWPNPKELPPELQPLTMRRAVSVPLVEGKPDFSVIDERLRELFAAAPAATASGNTPLVAERAIAGKPGGAPSVIVRSRWRMLWLQHRALFVIGAAALIAGMAGAAWLLLQRIDSETARGAISSRSWRATTVREALQLSPADLGSGKCVLVGEFRVSAARGDAAILRPVEAALAKSVRIDARFTSESARPADRALFRATSANRLIIGSRRRGADGQWTLSVSAAE